jgi:hypothetical protein
MKKILIALAVVSSAIALPALADSLSLSVGQPGFYGRINIGGYPPPDVVYAQPVVVEQGVPMDQPPVYMRVPPEQSGNWGRYCHHYHACGQRVMFVQDGWYHNQYSPNYYHHHHHGWGNNGQDHNHYQGQGQDQGQHQHNGQQWQQP